MLLCGELNKNLKQIKKRKNLFKFTTISFFVILSFFSLPTIKIFIDKNLNYKKTIISNAGVNFDQELEKRKKVPNGETETQNNKLSNNPC